jgi:hypothetical protein
VGDAQAGPRAGTSRRELCVGLAFCMLSTACRGLQCLCGTVASGNCISSGVGNGQCRNQVLAAGESNIFGTVAVRTIDPNLALNRAFAVGTCASSAACTDVCDPGP